MEFPVDPFTGVWRFNAARSRVGAPPESWIQEIAATPSDVHVREEIVRAGSRTVVTVDAKFDGRDYPVNGWPMADVIAYARDGNRISGTAKKNGIVSLRETIVASDDSLTMTYAVFGGGKEVAAGVAVFEKLQSES
jgi:hypothetical protein